MGFLVVFGIIALSRLALHYFYEPEMEKPFWQRHLAITLSAQEFFQVVEEIISEQSIPGLRTKRVLRFERNLFSARREYLRIWRWKNVIEISGFKFGQGFYVSARRGKIPSLHRKLFPPNKSKGGKVLDYLISPSTAFKIDSKEAFDSTVTMAVEGALQAMGGGKGFRHSYGKGRLRYS